MSDLVKKAKELASQLWCTADTSHIEFDVRLAEAAAEEFHGLLDQIEAKDKEIANYKGYIERLENRINGHDE